jgi:hypothetical protein
LRSKPTGNQIPVKIAANREKRLNIAEAMKTEAGVTAHTINSEDFAGLAYLGTGQIDSPRLTLFETAGAGMTASMLSFRKASLRGWQWRVCGFS